MNMAKKFYRNKGIMQERSRNLSRTIKLKKGRNEPERHDP
jgi:hypothetical protein